MIVYDLYTAHSSGKGAYVNMTMSFAAMILVIITGLISLWSLVVTFTFSLPASFRKKEPRRKCTSSVANRHLSMRLATVLKNPFAPRLVGVRLFLLTCFHEYMPQTSCEVTFLSALEYLF